MNSPLLTLAAKLSLDSSEYEKGLDNAEEKAGGFGSKLKSGLATAGKVAGVAVAAVGTAAVATGKAIVSGASEIADYGNNIDKMSQKIGISAEAYQEWDAILTHAGASVDSLQTVMKTLSTAAETGKDALSQLGITEEEVANLSQEDLFARVISGLQDMEAGTERTYLATQLLGRGAMEMGALLNTSSEETEKMRRRVHELGGVMSDEAVKSAATFQDNLQDMQTAFSGLKRGIMADALPAFNNLMSGFTKLIIGSEGAQEEIESGIDDFVAFLTDGVEKIAEIGQTIIPALGKALIDNTPALLPAVLSLVGQVGTMILDNLPQLLSTALTLVKTLGDGLIESLPVLLPQVVSVIMEIAKMLTNPESISTLIDTAFSLIDALLGGILDAIPIILDALPSILVNIATAVIMNLPKILTKIPVILGKIVSSVIENLPVLIKMIPTIIVELVKAFLDPKNMRQILNIGTELIKGLWNGIKDAGAWLWDKISGFFGGVLSKIKNFFGIKSPSKVFAGIGEMLDRGLAKGIDDYAILAEKATDNLAEDVLGAMDDVSAGLPNYNMSANITSGNNALTGLGNTLIMNVYGAVGQDVSELAEIISQKIAFNYDIERRAFA